MPFQRGDPLYEPMLALQQILNIVSSYEKDL